jgi:hypothetical protein
MLASLAMALALPMLLHTRNVRADVAGVGGVAIIAHSVSTSMKAREIRAKLGWLELSPKEADYVLVVCRSMLFHPLSPAYDSYEELDDDAKQQLNISGSNFHTYVYQINSDQSVTQIVHDSYEADD